MAFAADWLSLREPADHDARDAGLVTDLAQWAATRESLRIFDLGSGTGSTLRALGGHLPGHQRWTLFDIDPVLRTRAEELIGDGPFAECLESVEAADLSADLESVLTRGPDILTASALIDLCSADWLDRLAEALPRQTALYIALTYDGREQWPPEPPQEDRALAAFAAHQRGDKGFGPSLGPGAAQHLAAALEQRGRRVVLRNSPWRIPGQGALAQELARGGADAVREMEVFTPEDWSAWRAGRLTADTVVVGHLDLLSLPE